MKYLIEISHHELTLVKMLVDGEIVFEQRCHGTAQIETPASPQQLEIWFEPWKIKPLVRIDNIMVNYALAGIRQYDHKLELILDRAFRDEYHQRDIEFRKLSVFGDRSPDPYVYDSVIGHGHMHEDILDDIRSQLSDK